MRWWVVTALLFGVLGLGGCSSCDDESDTTPDAGVINPDATGPDALPDGAAVDAPVLDAPVLDAPVLDAPVLDAPVLDAPVPDAPVPDAPVPDAPAPDALPDSAVADAQSVDAAPPFPCEGDLVAYVADQAVANQRELFVVGVDDAPLAPADRVNHPMDPDENEEVEVNLGQLFAWSPDGSRLAYRVRHQSSANALYVADMSGVPFGVGVEASSYIEDDGAVRDFAWSPDSTKIAYVADRSGNGVFQLFVADVNNPGVEYLAMTSQMIITLNGLEGRSYFWSPDSKKLLYRATVFPSTDVDLYFTDVTQVATPVMVNAATPTSDVREWISWSPDGSMIAYFVGKLYVARVVAGAVTARQALTAGFGWNPLWSPDGTNLAFYAGAQIYISDVSAWPPGTATSLTAGYPYTGHRDMAWSPNSLMVAFLALHDGIDMSLSIVDTVGAAQAMPVVVSTSAAGEAMPGYLWSPNSEMLLYRQSGGTTGLIELYMTSATTPSTQHTINGMLPMFATVDATFAWSPDSSGITYTADAEADHSNELYLVSLVSQAPLPPVKLNTQLPTNGHVASHSWSPDGTRVLYIADQTLGFTLEALLVNVSGPTPGAPQRINSILITEGDVWQAKWRRCP